MSKSLNTRFTRLSGQPSVLCQHIFRAPTRKYTEAHPHGSRFQTADCLVSRFIISYSLTPAHTQTLALSPHDARALLFSPRSCPLLLPVVLSSPVSQPLFPVAHASSIPSPENFPKRSEFRRLPSDPNFAALRLHSSTCRLSGSHQSVYIPPDAHTRLPVANLPPLRLTPIC